MRTLRNARLVVGLASVSLVMSAAVVPAVTAAPNDRASAAEAGFAELAPASYVVLMRQPASTVYSGGVDGLPATRGTKDKPFNPRSSAVRRYEEYLRTQKQDVIAGIGSPEIVYSFETATNGFAATLAGTQAAKLAGDSRVLAVVPNDKRTLDTVHSPAFLDLSTAGGGWDQAGGAADAGKGVVVGIIDSGVWPESASFAGQRVGKNGRPIVVQKADGGTFAGQCQAGENFPSNTCNDKLVSARFYVAGFKDANRKSGLASDEYLSPRDGAGHGSHTASTAVGNAGVPVSIDGQDFGTASGMAPAAKLAVYKVCWEATDEDATGCYGADSVAAIDQAVRDGVDVINFSISGSTTTTVDAVEYAFFGAAAAGVFVAASAGNAGPTEGTVAHPSPWITTVAASTHYLYEGTVVLGNGKSYVGAMVSDTGVAETGLVYAGDVGADSAAPADVKLCVPGTLDPTAVAGTIVVCDRGGIDRVAKSAAVKAAGGVGMVLANPTENSLDPDFHSVPTVHVGVAAGDDIRTYAQTTGAKAALVPGNLTGVDSPNPVIAGFSSRGPSAANQGDLLKPDISAPGVGVVAAVSPPHNSGRSYDLYSGTSMSSPHIAGLGALILGEHPDWSPAKVKSAMMTTAYDLEGSVDPMAQGAGHVNPATFLKPGLAYDADLYDWAQFYKGQGLDLFAPESTDEYEPILPADLNTPSIQIGQLAGTKTVTRTVTALQAGTWTAAVEAPEGVDVTVVPSTLTLESDAEGEFMVTMDVNQSATLAEFTAGFLTWSNGSTEVRIPLALRPVSVAAPADVAGSTTGGSGSVPVTVTGGRDGLVDIAQAGLVPGDVASGTLVPGQEAEYVVEVPAGSSFARFDLDAANDAADLDLVVYQLTPDGTSLVDVFVSATGSADERVNILGPDAGVYLAYASGYANAPGETTSAYRQSNFVVGQDPADWVGGLDVSPNPLPVSRGEEATFTVSWTELDDTARYLGWVGYEGALQPTIITVN